MLVCFELTFHLGRAGYLQVIHDHVDFFVELLQRGNRGLCQPHLGSIASHFLTLFQLGHEPIHLCLLATASGTLHLLTFRHERGSAKSIKAAKGGRVDSAKLAVRSALLCVTDAAATVADQLRFFFSQDELGVATAQILAATSHVMLLMLEADSVRLVRIFSHLLLFFRLVVVVLLLWVLRTFDDLSSLMARVLKRRGFASKESRNNRCAPRVTEGHGTS